MATSDTPPESPESDAPILLLDSGVGGLSVLAQARKLLPQVSWIYLYDAAGFPYGTKSETEIASRVPALLGKAVERFRPRLVTIACNTASTIALDAVRFALDTPIVGTVPAIKPAAEASKTRVIGLLGTEATVRQPYVDNLAKKFAQDCTILRYGAAELVGAAEAKLRGETPDPAIFRQAIDGLMTQPCGHDIDVVVLACTHFPLVREELSSAVGDGVGFVDGAAGIARRIAYLTKGDSWPDRPAPGQLVTTGSLDAMAPYRAQLLGYGLESISEL